MGRRASHSNLEDLKGGSEIGLAHLVIHSVLCCQEVQVVQEWSRDPHQEVQVDQEDPADHQFHVLHSVQEYQSSHPNLTMTLVFVIVLMLRYTLIVQHYVNMIFVCIQTLSVFLLIPVSNRRSDT